MTAVLTFLLALFIGSVVAMLAICIVNFRPRWYLIQNLGWNVDEWVPAKLWGLPGCKPLCLMVFRAWGPFPTQDAALAAWEKKYGQADNQHASNS